MYVNETGRPTIDRQSTGIDHRQPTLSGSPGHYHLFKVIGQHHVTTSPTSPGRQPGVSLASTSPPSTGLAPPISVRSSTVRSSASSGKATTPVGHQGHRHRHHKDVQAIRHSGHSIIHHSSSPGHHSSSPSGSSFNHYHRHSHQHQDRWNSQQDQRLATQQRQ